MRWDHFEIVMVGGLHYHVSKTTYETTSNWFFFFGFESEGGMLSGTIVPRGLLKSGTSESDFIKKI